MMKNRLSPPARKIQTSFSRMQCQLKGPVSPVSTPFLTCIMAAYAVMDDA